MTANPSLEARLPDTYGHFEFFTFSEGTRIKDQAAGALPGVELNYGLIPNGQLTIGGGAAFNTTGESVSHYGPGDTNLSFKYHFIEESPFSPQVSNHTHYRGTAYSVTVDAFGRWWSWKAKGEQRTPLWHIVDGD